jgi:hypothetical protein
MAVYMVDRNLPAIHNGATSCRPEGGDRDGKAAHRRRQARALHPKHFHPARVPLQCLFEASNPELVKQLNDEAKIPYTRVIEAADLTP